MLGLVRPATGGHAMTTVTTQQARDFRGTHSRSPKELRELVSHVGAELELAPAEDIVEWAVATFGKRFCITSSMGDAVLAHVASRVAPGVDVVFLDTGYHFAETIGTADAVGATMDVNLIPITPVQTVAEQDAAYGPELYKRDPDLCCKTGSSSPVNTLPATRPAKCAMSTISVAPTSSAISRILAKFTRRGYAE